MVQNRNGERPVAFARSQESFHSLIQQGQLALRRKHSVSYTIPNGEWERLYGQPPRVGKGTRLIDTVMADLTQVALSAFLVMDIVYRKRSA